MAGVWKKTLNYLGLVEEDEDFVDEMPEAEPATVRRMRPQSVSDAPADAEGTVRTIASPRPVAAGPSAIHKSEPKRFNEAREVADRFKEGTAVIMNLQSTDDTIARRLVDFASGALSLPDLSSENYGALVNYVRTGGTWTGSESQLLAKSAGLFHLLAGSGEYQFV